MSPKRDSLDFDEQHSGWNAISNRLKEVCGDTEPSHFGVFSIVYNGKLVSYTYEKNSKLDELLTL
ncbi:MAG: hypothetical protein JW779_15980 [Candidatus Thorarchaeota archaeon]|nr:hypothetical protein [Candidatus Thorarchaeota archaeon]